MKEKKLVPIRIINSNIPKLDGFIPKVTSIPDIANNNKIRYIIAIAGPINIPNVINLFFITLSTPTGNPRQRVHR
jgi:hypothetical protein